MKRLQGHSKKSAFTIVEMLVVIVITAVLAIVAIPAMRNSVNTRQAAEVISAHLHYAQQLAITTGKEHGVSFNTALETYEVYREDSGEVIIDNPLDRSQLKIDLTKSPYNNVDVVSASFVNGGTDTSKILFESTFGIPKADNDGTNPEITSGTITLSGGGVTRTVTVEPTTGKVTIQ